MPPSASKTSKRRGSATQAKPARQAKLERTLQGLQTKMNYICRMNQTMQSGKGADGGPTSSVLLRVKRYIDNNRAITAMFMLFLNIGSRYINLNITTSQEYYLRKMLVPEILIFCVSWMGSRDILIAACITFVYSLVTRIFFNENSNFCIVKHQMNQIKHLIDTNEDKKISDKELENAIRVLSKAKEKQPGGKPGSPSDPIDETPAQEDGDDPRADDASYAMGAVGAGSYGIDFNVAPESEMTLFGNDPVFEPMQSAKAAAPFSSPISTSEPFTNLPSTR